MILVAMMQEPGAIVTEIARGRASIRACTIAGSLAPAIGAAARGCDVRSCDGGRGAGGGMRLRRRRL